MKKIKKPIALLLACLMITGSLVITAFAATTGTGTREDPYVCTSLSDLPSSAEIASGEYVFFSLPAGGMTLTVEDPSSSVIITGPLFQYLAYTSDAGGTATYTFTEAANGETVIFGLYNQSPDSSATAYLSISEAATPAVGTYENPENANDRYFSFTQSFLINTDIAEGDEDGYWYEFTASKAGVICLENSAIDANGASTTAYQIILENGTTQSLAIDGVQSNPLTTFKVSKGDKVKINMYALPDADGNYPYIKIYANIVMVNGTTDDPVNVKSKEGFKAYVKSDSQIIYQDGTSGGLYGGKGIVVTGYKDAIKETEIIVNNVSYTDTDGDGKIELNLPGSTNSMIASHPAFTIVNNFKWDASYTVTLTDSAEEGEYEPEVTLGDVNCDGKINLADIYMAKSIIIGSCQDPIAIANADMDQNGSVNIADLYLLKNVLI